METQGIMEGMQDLDTFKTSLEEWKPSPVPRGSGSLSTFKTSLEEWKLRILCHNPQPPIRF